MPQPSEAPAKEPSSDASSESEARWPSRTETYRRKREMTFGEKENVQGRLLREYASMVQLGQLLQAKYLNKALGAPRARSH